MNRWHVHILFFTFAFSLAGCAMRFNAPPAPLTSTAGAGIGAIAGGVIAPAPIWPGVVMGAVVGAALGDYVDKHVTLATQLSKYGVQIYQVGDQVNIVLPADQFFQYHSPVFKSHATHGLDKVVLLLNQTRKDVVKISAYTDNDGTPERNMALSQQWANNISDYLWGHGADMRLVYPVGYGDCMSVASNQTAAGRALNRRIEITFNVI